MQRFCNTNSDCSSKDAFFSAPSVKFADFSDNFVAATEVFANISILTGIAAAVSVFLFFIISVIFDAIMCGISIISYFIITAIIIFAIGIIIDFIKNEKINSFAKL